MPKGNPRGNRKFVICTRGLPERRKRFEKKIFRLKSLEFLHSFVGSKAQTTTSTIIIVIITTDTTDETRAGTIMFSSVLGVCATPYIIYYRCWNILFFRVAVSLKRKQRHYARLKYGVKVYACFCSVRRTFTTPYFSVVFFFCRSLSTEFSFSAVCCAGMYLYRGWRRQRPIRRQTFGRIFIGQKDFPARQ